ncbi:MAG: hypothetical protein AAGA57_02170 [Planctomycetota bacterium]
MIRTRSRAIAAAACSALAIACFTALGCASPLEPTMITVAPQYTDLANRTVAVLASVDPAAQAMHPGAPDNLIRGVSANLVDNVPGAIVAEPDGLIAFQRNNPAWSTVRPTRLVEALGVDRLIILDVAEYRTHEPGNAAVREGLIQANVDLYEAESPDPDQRALTAAVTGRFPRNRSVGEVTASSQSVERATLVDFCLRAAGVFHQHEIPEER